MTQIYEGWKKAGEEEADIPHMQENAGFFNSFPTTLVRTERSLRRWHAVAWQLWHELAGSQGHDYSSIILGWYKW